MRAAAAGAGPRSPSPLRSRGRGSRAGRAVAACRRSPGLARQTPLCFQGVDRLPDPLSVHSPVASPDVLKKWPDTRFFYWSLFFLKAAWSPTAGFARGPPFTEWPRRVTPPRATRAPACREVGAPGPCPQLRAPRPASPGGPWVPPARGVAAAAQPVGSEAGHPGLGWCWSLSRKRPRGVGAASRGSLRRVGRGAPPPRRQRASAAVPRAWPRLQWQRRARPGRLRFDWKREFSPQS